MMYHIVAIDSNRSFAKTSSDGVPYIPWDIPSDRQQYEEHIAGKAVLMGHATYRVRPDVAYSFVLSNDETLIVEHGERVASIQEVLQKNGANDLWVIGGRTVYAPTIHRADRLLITHVIGEYGDVQYPEISPSTFKLVRQSPEQQENGFKFWFAEYERIQK